MLTGAVERLKQRQRHGAEDGFTLIEIVVALAIIVTTLLALLSGFIAAAHSQQTEKKRTVALRLANETMENLRSEGYAAVSGSGPTSVTRSATTFSVVVAVTERDAKTAGAVVSGQPTVKHAAVTVSWVNGAGTSSVNVISDIADLSQLIVTSLPASASPTPTVSPTASPSPSSSPTPVKNIVSFLVNPNPTSVNSSGTPTAALALSSVLSGYGVGEILTVQWTDDTGLHSTTMSSSDGVNWTGSIPASNVTRVVSSSESNPTLAFTLSTQSTTQTSAFSLPLQKTSSDTVTCSTATHTNSVGGTIVLEGNNKNGAKDKNSNDETFTCEASGIDNDVVANATVTFQTTAGAQQVNLVQQANKTTFTVTIPKYTYKFVTGSQTFTFTVTQTGKTSVSKSITVTVS